MKILVDMNLSPRWATVLRESGFDASHWSELGAANTPDSVIMQYAASNHFIILTNDLDFGVALATGNLKRPSVAQVRGDDLRPTSIGWQVIQALRQVSEELESGALLTIDSKRTRLRLLPLRGQEE